jgi:hypothetical protein
VARFWQSNSVAGFDGDNHCDATVAEMCQIRAQKIGIGKETPKSTACLAESMGNKPCPTLLPQRKAKGRRQGEVFVAKILLSRVSMGSEKKTFLN